MGKVILCSGVYSDGPYEVPGGKLVYSIEELCYYVYENAIKLEEDFFSADLIRWLREKVQMTEIAEKLEFLQENNYSFKDRVVALLCSADYYTEEEIIQLIKKMNAWENLPIWRKKKLQADELLMEGHFIKARSEYEAILAIEGIDDEDTGSVYHNIGVTKMHTASAREAAGDFYRAYQIGGNHESLKSALIACLIDGDIGRAENMCMSEGFGSELLCSCEAEYEKSMKEADMAEEIYAMTREQRMQHVSDWKKQVRRL